MALNSSGGPRIGVSDVYVASLTSGTDTALLPPTYGTPVKLAGTAKMTGNPNGKLITDWGDNGPFFVTNSRGNLQSSIELIDIDPAVLTTVLGQTYANGKTQEGAFDQSPWYALGFKVWIGGVDGSGNRIYDYYWYAKGKFTIPEQGASTKKESISPEHTTITGEFAKLLYNDVMCVHARSDDTAVSAATITNWYSTPVYSAAQDTGALTLTSATGTISTKTFAITFAKAGGGTATIADASASNVNVSIGSTGAAIALTTFTPGSASTTPTLSVVTSATLTGVPYTILVTSQLHDSNGVACVMKSISCTPA
jgi:phi13 family phage major tail protein